MSKPLTPTVRVLEYGPQGLSGKFASLECGHRIRVGPKCFYSFVRCYVCEEDARNKRRREKTP